MIILILQVENGYIVTVQNNSKQTVYIANHAVEVVDIINNVLNSKPTPIPN